MFIYCLNGGFIMSKEDKTYYIGFLGSFSDSDLLALFRFIRKMTDTPDVVQSEAIDFFGELEDICHFLVWSRFTDIVTSGIYPPLSVNIPTGDCTIHSL